MIKEELKMWEAATGHAKWGVQRAIKTTLELAQSGDVHLCYGADVSEGTPCLINSIHFMLSEDTLSPSASYPHIVRAFDLVNASLGSVGVNEHGKVSELAAEVLLANLGELKKAPEDAPSLRIEEVQAFLESLQGSEEGSELMKEVMGDPVTLKFSDDTPR